MTFNYRFTNPLNTKGLPAIALCIFLVVLYVLLYFYPTALTIPIAWLSPLSFALKNKPADQWFLYGFLYTVAVIVMGFRYLRKVWGQKYQMYRTLSVMFFQLCFAFILPEIMMRLNYPYQDLKNIWPLDYYFFFDYNIDNKLQAGTFGIFMLGWGIFLAVIAVPILTYLYGKRWYCSWVCGCGGLAETAGDPFRQLSDKSVKAWKIERYTIYSVLVFAIIMTAGVLYTYLTGHSKIMGLVDSGSLRGIYGFWIGGLFSGVVGTGFYPIMGNRVWCRFGCPLAAYMGIIQRFKSRYQITVNENQCISCGNCSTFCEMGIDVRAYAQRNENIVRASCVGCGICAAVCPRGVLKLENINK